jgi:hypothetical protein
MQNCVADQMFSAPASRQLIACEAIIASGLGYWGSIMIWRYFAVGWPYFAVVSALGLAESTVLLGQGLLMLRNLRRPMLRIAPGEIEHVPVTRWSARHIRCSDVVGVASSSGSKVVLKTVTGRERIRLGWLSRAQREDARTAIERWVANRGRAEREPTGSGTS